MKLYIVTWAKTPTKCAHLWYMRKSRAKETAAVISPIDLRKQYRNLVTKHPDITFAVTCDVGRKALDAVTHKPFLANYDVAYSKIVGCSDEIRAGVGTVRGIALPTLPMLNSSRVDKMLNYRYLERVANPDHMYISPTFVHHRITRHDCDEYYTLQQAISNNYINHSGRVFRPVLAAIDLETCQDTVLELDNGDLVRFGAVIDVFGVSLAGWFDGEEKTADNLTVMTFTIDFVREWQWELCRDVCASDIPKAFSNGMYDVQYLIRWGIPPKNVSHDTEYWLRAASPDLTGDYSLQAQANVYLQNSRYWKDAINSTDRAEYHWYNARDCHTTASVCVAQLLGMSTKNMRNFVIGYSRIPYALYSSMRGMEIDVKVMADLEAEYTAKAAELGNKFKAVLGCTVNQSAKILPMVKAVAAVNSIAGTPDVPTVEATDAKVITNIRMLDPIADTVFGWMQDCRRTEKWLSTYIRMSTWGNHMNGQTEEQDDGRRWFLWNIQPFGTISGRLSSNSSAFWVGMSAHTLPAEMRKMMKAPEGYVFISTDAPQSESRVTAYESRCQALIDAVESEHDFHAWNASAFFGIPYAEIYDDVAKKTLNKSVRNLAKRTNHGANYNMGAYVMATTMGTANVRFAQKALNLPEEWSVVQVCTFLLMAFASTYVEVKNDWPLELVAEVLKTGRVTCQVSGYSPVVTGNPLDFKPDLNTLISLVPQSTSAYISIKSAVRLFNMWMQDPTMPNPVLQVHDEVISLVKCGTPIDAIDNLIAEACANASKMKFESDPTGFKTMVIPVGDVVAGRTWDKLKEDPQKREASKQFIEDYC